MMNLPGLLRACRFAVVLGVTAGLVGCQRSGTDSSEVGATSTPGSSVPSSTRVSAASADLATRPSNPTCLAGDRPVGDGSIGLQRVYANLAFSEPVAMVQPKNDSSNWYVVERAGRIKKFNNLSGVSTATNFLDISDQVDSNASFEMGLLGMAFHPNYPMDPRVFINYTATVFGQIISHVSAFKTVDGGATLDRNTEQVLMTVNQPYANHKGGNLAFDADNLLYIGFGDGGSGNDPVGNGQSLNTLLGKMLRIDVGLPGDLSYSIPPNNPYAGNSVCDASGGTAPCPEIFAYGLRNPWRWSFDKLTDDLWVGDVGQSMYEEVDRVHLGGNYGWVCREGTDTTPNADQSSCTGSYINPVAEYDHGAGNAIVGGYVYRGTQNTPWLGKYIYGDWGSAKIWAYTPGQPGTQVVTGSDAIWSGTGNIYISSFAQGNDGELYVLDLGLGGVYKIDFQNATGTEVPDNLADTGCVSPSDITQPAAGLIPYDVNASFWSDGAAKERWFALPDGQQIYVEDNGHWSFPAGSVLMKTFKVDNKLVETRLMMRHNDGIWAGYTYEWNDAQTAATRVRDGKTRMLNLSNGGNQNWIYPSESDCLSCHNSAAGYSLGPTTAQFNRVHNYADGIANQLDTLSAIGVLSQSVNSATADKQVDPADTSADINLRARSYLQVNCAQCHQPGGPTPSNMDLRSIISLASTSACNVAPTAGDLGIGNARIIAPGDSAHSVLLSRVNVRDGNAMPPLASNVIDSSGVQLLSTWINSLTGCTTETLSSLDADAPLPVWAWWCLAAGLGWGMHAGARRQ